MRRFSYLAVGFVALSGTISACGSSSSSTNGDTVGGALSVGGANSTGGIRSTGGSRSNTGGTRDNVGGAQVNTGGASNSIAGSGNTGGTRVITLATGGAPGGTGGSLNGTGGGGAEVNTTALCNLEGQLAAQLNCPGFTSQQAVVATCMQPSGIPASCQATTDSLTACLSQQPTSSFQCSTNNDGTISVKTGVCPSETNALLACALGGTTGGCADLAPCCSQLTGTNQTNCQQVLAGGMDAVCGVALSVYQGLGECT